MVVENVNIAFFTSYTNVWHSSFLYTVYVDTNKLQYQTEINFVFNIKIVCHLNTNWTDDSAWLNIIQKMRTIDNALTLSLVLTVPVLVPVSPGEN